MQTTTKENHIATGGREEAAREPLHGGGAGAAYKYYAFISYNHRDEKWAKRVQRSLHDFRLPTVARKVVGQDIRIDPVFRYKTNLAPGPLRKLIGQELERSKYLLVICSPNSAQPNERGEHWVNDEVRRFMEMGRTDRIIPVIVGGAPNSSGADECFPPAIREAEISGVNLYQGGRTSRKYEFLRLVSRILGLDPDELIHEWKDDERRRWFWKIGLLTGLAAVLCLLAWWGNDHYGEHHACYRDYVNEWGEPKGLSEMTSQDIQQVFGHYRFTWQGYLPDGRRKLKSVRFCDSYGREQMRCLEENDLIKAFLRHPMGRDYFWTDAGKIKRIREYQTDGTPHCDYVFASEDVVDVHNADDRAAMSNLSVGQGLNLGDRLRYDPLGLKETIPFLPFLRPQSRVTRYFIAKRRSDGLPMRILFMAAGAHGKPVCDEKGVWGKDLDYDDCGRVTYVGCLGKDGRLLCGCDYHRRTKYEKDRIIETCVDESGNAVTNSDGWVSMAAKFDLNGNWREVERLDAEHRLVRGEMGWARCLLEYDIRDGKMKDARFEDDQRKPFLKGGIAGFRIGSRDDKGRISQVETLNLAGELEDCGLGAVRIEFDHSNDGIVERYYDSQRNPVRSNSLGVYQRKRVLNNGVLKEMICLDRNGGFMNCKNGFARMRCDYTEDGLLKELSMWMATAPGKLSLIRREVVDYEIEYGEPVACSVRFLNENGQPTVSSDGIDKMVYRKDGAGRVYELEYFYNGKRRGCKRIGFDSNDRVCSFDLIGENDRPLATNAYGGVSLRITNILERVARFYYVNADGKPVPADDGTRIVEKRYDTSGNVVREACFDWDGVKPMIRPGLNYHERIVEYDSFHRMREESYRDSGERPVENAQGCDRKTFEYNPTNAMVKVKGFKGQRIVGEWDYDGTGRAFHAVAYGENGARRTSAMIITSDSLIFGQIKKGDYAWLVNGYPVCGGSEYANLLFPEAGLKSARAVFARKQSQNAPYQFYSVDMDMTFPDPSIDMVEMSEEEYQKIRADYEATCNGNLQLPF